MTRAHRWIKGRCPACGSDGTLFVAEGGHLTCSLLGCPNPCALDEILTDPHGSKHVVRFGEDGFDIQHPLSERGDDLVECSLHQYVRSLAGPPVKPGRYIAYLTEGHWAWQEMAA